MIKRLALILEEQLLIQHRYPFLSIDKVVDIVPHLSAICTKNVTFNEKKIFSVVI